MSLDGRLSGTIVLMVGLLTLAVPSKADVAILTLDGLSFLSFNDQVTTSIPGGWIRFNFGAANTDGTVPFLINPSDVSLTPLSVPGSDAGVQYVLTTQATGTMTPTPTGKRIAFAGTIAAKDVGADEPGQRNYTVNFTTEIVSAEDVDGTTEVTRQGVRVPVGARYVQLVGATVSQSENREGDAVYVVLSGSFDRVP